MDKSAIKKYAVWARRELISRVAGRAAQYGVTEDGWGNADADSVNGHVLSATEKKQRIGFIKKVQSEGYEQAVEEVAYTWFNRFCALRYMEVNGYLPSHVRVFTNEAGEFKPEILDEALHLDIDGLDMDKVIALKEDAQKTEDLFRYLLITQCNALNSILPGMFQKIEDYTELLLPENLLREGSVIEQMIVQIPEKDWTDQVQIIGWLYQYYNIEPSELVYDGNMSKTRIPKELLPAATTIYTPDWVVRYMVENSLGRLWIEGHPNDELKSGWKYYLDEAEQDPEVEAQLAGIRKEYATLKPKDIKCIDPCAGSGHILCYMFDIFMEIYESYGCTAQEAVSSIVGNNLYGLDIDERAAQLAYFAVMMKARSYDRRFFSRGIQPHVYAICESNDLDQNAIDYFAGNDPNLRKDFGILVEELHDAKEYGSILNITPVNFDSMYIRTEEIRHGISLYSTMVSDQILPLIQVGQTLAQKYDVVITNPPYLGSSRFSLALDRYVKENYPDDKSDLSMVMLRKAMQGFSKRNGFIAFITTSSWMSISSFEKIRKYILSKLAISSLVDFGTELFEGKVGHNPIVSWVNRNSPLDYNLTAIRLVDYCYSRRDEKEPEFFDGRNIYTTQQSSFSKIPGSPVAYWVSDTFVKAFERGISVDSISKYTGSQNITANNDKYLRFLWEVSSQNIGRRGKWVFYMKGGSFRKWYGNIELVVDWSENARAFYKKNSSSNLLAEPYRFKEGITYTELTSGTNSFRYLPPIAVFDKKGPSIVDNQYNLYCLGFFNSIVAQQYFKVLNPTITLQIKDVKNTPIIIDNKQRKNVETLVLDNITFCKTDWDSFEASWDFQCHPLVRSFSTISESYLAWEDECNNRFTQLKFNEEELNRIFINIYSLQDELTPEEEDKDVTVRKADLQRDIKSLISYAVGCMFGRYSLDVDGLAYAGGEWDPSKYKTYQPDYNGILPICDDEYFTDDIVGHFVDFIRTVYGEDTLEENLQFIADALGGSGSSREVIRKYFLNDFYTDHCKTYQKRPIYWLFDSGKKNGFKCLICMHRYRPDTIARIRTDYVHEQQARYRTAIEDVEKRITDASTSDRIKLNKQLKKLQDQSEELLGYEEKIHHLADQFIEIDLDDGVKVNYAKFQDVLAKIK